MRGQCIRILCEGDYNEEFPKCGWCNEVEQCKEVQKLKETEQ